ncbi:MAG TPA: ribose-5-phosphate isomerase RpiA [Verrucomicrobiae bacterium]|nr:ribose-5-phosphate isomerase RpiA [Verrucomicrobiae bacterium]
MTQVGAAAAALIPPGICLGIGSGRTVASFLGALAPRIAAGLGVAGVCASLASEELARQAGVEVIDGVRTPLDLDIDGADEIDSELGCLKGGGGALLREKVIAVNSRRLWILVTSDKRVARLGSARPLPVEVLPFGWEWTAERLRDLGLEPARRGGEHPLRTDNGNFVLDCTSVGGLPDPAGLDRSLSGVPGVVGHGLFLKLATAALVADGEQVTRLGDLDARRGAPAARSDPVSGPAGRPSPDHATDPDPS